MCEKIHEILRRNYNLHTPAKAVTSSR